MKVKKGVWIAALGALVLVCAVLLGNLNKTLKVKTVGLPATTKPLVILDAGHGGMDGGAVGNGITEKEINLKIAQKTRDLCQLFGFEVIMTRDSDISIHDSDKTTVRSQKNSDLKNRLAIMTEPPGAVVVSIHLNKFPQSYVHGAQVFYAPKAADSDVLAEMMQLNFREKLQPGNERKIKKADSALFLLYNNTINPAILVECGFLSNPDEAALLKKEEYQDQIAMTICYTLMKYNGRGDETTYGNNGQG